MQFIDFQLLDGSWMDFNIIQIAAISKDEGGGSLLYTNGTYFRLKSSIDTVKTELKQVGVRIP